jgi:hypothetical protein
MGLQDYDDWAALTNDPGWPAANLQQYMRKHQVLLHGHSGMYMHTARTSERTYIHLLL